MKILLAVAMPSESDDIIACFQMKKNGKLANFYPYYSIQIGSREIFLLVTHVGSINAPVATSIALEKIKPNVVIKVGCVGANSSGFKKNDIVVPKVYFHSGAWITRSYIDNTPTNNAGIWQTLYGDKPYQNSKKNLGGLDFLYLPDKDLTNKYRTVLKSEKVKFVEAPIGSGDMVIFDHALMKNIRTNILKLNNSKSPWCTENESYSIAQVCHIYKVPFTGVYFIASSDYEDIDGYDPLSIKTQTQQTILPIVEKFVMSLNT